MAILVLYLNFINFFFALYTLLYFMGGDCNGDIWTQMIAIACCYYVTIRNCIPYPYDFSVLLYSVVRLRLDCFHICNKIYGMWMKIWDMRSTCIKTVPLSLGALQTWYGLLWVRKLWRLKINLDYLQAVYPL